jgi:hypothetical protein
MVSHGALLAAVQEQCNAVVTVAELAPPAAGTENIVLLTE